jgi:hypothetical protein
MFRFSIFFHNENKNTQELLTVYNGFRWNWRLGRAPITCHVTGNDEEGGSTKP